MAVGVMKQSAPSGIGNGMVAPVAAMSAWAQIHDDLDEAAASSTVIANPLSSDNTKVHVLKLNGASRVQFRCKYNHGCSAMAQTPRAAIYLAWAASADGRAAMESGTLPVDASASVMRIDTIDPDGDGMDFTIDPTNDIRDGSTASNFKFSAPATYFPITSGYGDTFGAPYLFALLQRTATGTSLTSIVLEALPMGS